MIAFLHTSAVHIKRFDELVRKYNKTIPLKHFVNEDLLNNALKTGIVDLGQFNEQLNEIKTYAPDMIICTCSTLGDRCDGRDDIERIDQPVLDYLVRKYNTFGLAYTATSTKTPSLNLIHTSAASLAKHIEIVEIDCTRCWSYFEQGDLKKYRQEIAQNIMSEYAKLPVIFFAQASMEGAKQYLATSSQEIFSSSEFGIKYFLEQYAKRS